MKSMVRVHRRALAAAAALALLASSQAAAQPAQPAAPATEAEYLERVAAFEREAAPSDPAYLDALAGLSHFYVRQGRFSDALPVLRRALAASERMLGSEHDTTQEIRAAIQLTEGFVNRP